MTWTRDRVYRLREIQQQAASLSLNIERFILSLPPDTSGLDDLIVTNEHAATVDRTLSVSLERVRTIYELSDALGEMAYKGI